MPEEIKNTEGTQPESKTEPTANPDPAPAARTYTEEEYTALQAQLQTANDTIRSYEDMDIDGIKASVEDYKQKYEQSETERKAFEHRTRINDFVKGLNLRDDIYEKHVAELLVESGCKFDDKGKLIGGNDIVNNFKEKYPDAFRRSQQLPEFSAPTPGKDGARDDDAFVRAVMGLK